MSTFSKGVVYFFELVQIWQLNRWFLSEIWQLKVIFYPKYGGLLEKVITFETNIKAYVG